MKGARATPRGRWRFDVPAALGRVVLIAALPDFHARYPEIQIGLGVSDRSADLIAETVDCVVRAGEIADQSLVARRIGEFRTVLCASPAYLKRYGIPRHPRELENSAHHIVGFSSRHTARPYLLKLQRNGEGMEIADPHIVSADHATACLAASVAGLGIVHTATFMAAPHIATGALVPLLQGWCERPIPLYVAYPPSRHLSAKLRAFVDWVAELFSSSSLIS